MTAWRCPTASNFDKARRGATPRLKRDPWRPGGPPPPRPVWRAFKHRLGVCRRNLSSNKWPKNGTLDKCIHQEREFHLDRLRAARRSRARPRSARRPCARARRPCRPLSARRPAARVHHARAAAISSTDIPGFKASSRLRAAWPGSRPPQRREPEIEQATTCTQGHCKR